MPAVLERLSETEARLVLHQGVYHQVKRMIAVLGGTVTALHREGFGPLVLDSLAVGQVRALTEAEIASLE
jgi:16S rRNA pseudouridine516 synthase